MQHRKLYAADSRPSSRLSLQIFSTVLIYVCLFSPSAHAQTSEAKRETKDAAAKAASSEPATDSKQETGDRADALRAEIEAAKNEESRARLRRALVDYLIEQNRKAEALEILRAMAREERYDPTGFYNTGNALLRLGDESAAIEAYRKAIAQRKGNYARAHNNLGVVLLRTGRWDEAYASFVAALRLENFRYAEASYNLGRLYAARGEADLAIREWRHTLSLDPAHADAALALARALAAANNPARALLVLDSYTARNGANSAIAAARREISSGASVVERRPDAGANQAYASTSAKGANPTVGVDTRRVSRADKGAPAASTSEPALDQGTYELLERARAARREGRYEEALRDYRRVIAERQGYFPAANLEQSYALIYLNRYDEAIASLREVTTRDGARYPMAYYHLARLYEERGELTPAAEAYERAAAAYGDDNPQFLLDISRVREKEGNYRAALAAMESYIEISKRLGRSPDWSTAHLAELRRKAETSKK